MSEATVARRLDAAETAVRQATALQPRLAVVLGSGLGGLAGELAEGVRIPYSDIPFFPESTAPGHAGALVLGELGDVPVALLAGRAHLYEGYDPSDVVFNVRLMRRLGAGALMITNAAGGVNLDFKPGLLMLISDHLNLTGRNPLVGTNDPGLGLRFPDMSEAYDARLRALARESAGELGIELAEGVYAGLLGPSYETPAEIRMLRALGADAVGMSTVLEVIAANHAGLRVLGISVISNMAAGVLPQKLTEEEVIETANSVREPFTALVRRIVQEYGRRSAAGREPS